MLHLHSALQKEQKSFYSIICVIYYIRTLRFFISLNIVGSEVVIILFLGYTSFVLIIHIDLIIICCELNTSPLSLFSVMSCILVRYELLDCTIHVKHDRSCDRGRSK